ncbi:hypothetical protein Pmani_031629 [Petrolisthes manimaculis]|uniref:Uncharacterized protein n=1 Tax=Petrolisthes manimaculis TaxID=1843537 RepID=A0AAE1TRT4_9EUCA|nr:hypothetical protein Pmani_031629 [Petrolisthes manimaculis]
MKDYVPLTNATVWRCGTTFPEPRLRVLSTPEEGAAGGGGGGGGVSGDAEEGQGGVLDVARFTVLDPTRPALIRATYGPFSTKQTVPARYVLPEFPDDPPAPAPPNASESGLPRPLPPVPHQLEVSAHLVNQVTTPLTCVSPCWPRRGSDSLSASCTPTGAGETGGDATCLVTLNVPARWWPPHTRATVKIPRVAVQVSYLVGTAAGPAQCAARDATPAGPGQGPRVTVQPETPVGEVILTLDHHNYQELAGPLLHILVPRAPLHQQLHYMLHSTSTLQATYLPSSLSSGIHVNCDDMDLDNAKK